jgi:hypothetical protein
MAFQHFSLAEVSAYPDRRFSGKWIGRVGQTAFQILTTVRFLKDVMDIVEGIPQSPGSGV